MFAEIENGTCVEIQSLKCYIPAEGYIWDYEAGKWYFDGVHKHARNFADCFWRRDPRWDLYLKWKAEQDKRQKQDEDFSHAELDKFIDDCWRWRYGGYWFYNNGVPTYITGIHWYYLSCYWMGKIFPDYRDFDRQFFYAWDYVDEDPLCAGIIYVTKRRLGKSYIAGCLAVERTSRRRQFRTGLQSKTKPDAKKLFERAIIAPYRRLPYFFKPETLLKAGGAPANILKFDKGQMDAGISEDLSSSIDYAPSSELAYDGEELGFYISDEFGKTLEANVSERWDVAKMCLIDNTGRIIGKSIHITTVEKIEGGAGEESLAAATTLWKESDPNVRDANGQTLSWLYKFFMPAPFAGKPDKYGFCDVEAETVRLQATIDAIADPRRRAQARRKNPFNERDAFSIDLSQCAFSNMEGLNRQFENLNYMPARFRVGNFQWVDGVQNTTVEFTECENGRFAVAWMPDEAHQNLKRQRGGVWYPCNTDMSCGGCDPYDHRILTIEGTKTMSKGAICFVKLPNVLTNSSVDDSPCLLYMNRPAAPEMFYEDCLMASVFYGCEVLIEDNKSGCIDHFNDRGHGGYLAWLPNRTKPGITNTAPTSGAGVNGQVFALLDSYVTHHIESCVYPVLIDQLLKFTVTDTTKFDGAMAFGFAKILQKKIGVANNRPKAEKAPDIKSILPASMYADGGRTLFGY